MMPADGPARRPRGSRHELRRRLAARYSRRTENDHPDDLVVVVLVDAGSRRSVEGRCLTCFAALQVGIVEGSPVFAMHHVAATRGEDRDGVMERVADLCSGREVVLGSAQAQVSFVDRRHLLASGIDLLDAVEVSGHLPPHHLVLFARPEVSMARLSAEFALDCCHLTRLDDQARCASARAQLVWIAYARAMLGRRRAGSLLAAYRAWALIEKCRPVPF